jgi:hypothetical protein
MHMPERPGWCCVDCRQAWPCREKKAGLLAEHADARTVLMLYMSAHLGDAIDDYRLGCRDSVSGLFDRFLGWVLDPSAESDPADAPLRWAAWQVADSLSDAGYAFIEDDKVEDLATALRSFLHTAGVPVSRL